MQFMVNSSKSITSLEWFTTELQQAGIRVQHLGCLAEVRGVSRAPLRAALEILSAKQDTEPAEAIALGSRAFAIAHLRYLMIVVGRPPFEAPLVSRLLFSGVPALAIGALGLYAIIHSAMLAGCLLALFGVFTILQTRAVVAALTREFVLLDHDGSVTLSINDPVLGCSKHTFPQTREDLALGWPNDPDGGQDIFPLYELRWPRKLERANHADCLMGYSYELLTRTISFRREWL